MNGSPAIQSADGGAMTFTTTHWSVVLEAQSETPAARRALQILCQTYWRPLYGFARRQGLGREDAQDLVQEFFAVHGILKMSITLSDPPNEKELSHRWQRRALPLS